MGGCSRAAGRARGTRWGSARGTPRAEIYSLNILPKLTFKKSPRLQSILPIYFPN